MKATLSRQIGDMQLSVEVEGKDEKDIFAQLAFWSSVPTEHPTGARDFKFAVRPAKTSAGKSVKYYEITCQSADQRFSFGQATDEAGGGLFPKSWENIYHGSDDGERNDHPPPPPIPPPQRPRAVPNAQPPARPAAQASGASTEKSLDARIRQMFASLGIDNPGKEKMTIKTALNSKSGMLLVELAPTEKQDLAAYLESQLNNQQRRTA